MFRLLHHRMPTLFASIILLCALSLSAQAQNANEAPLTSQQLVRLVYQFHDYPQRRDEIIGEIRQRGLGFPLTSGLRSVIATKSGNDATLRRTIEEAERRRLNPTLARPPSEAESADILAKTRTATLAAVEAMPDFVVKQLITRSIALGTTQNWHALDRLALAVNYRASTGAEEYKLLAINGLSPSFQPGQSFEDVIGGYFTSGDYVNTLSAIFSDASRTSFQMVDTDTLRGHRTVVYEYAIGKQFSQKRLKAGSQETITGDRGRIWIDRETYRVLRVESMATDIPSNFPTTSWNNLVDYDFVTIAERQYLLPSRSEAIITFKQDEQVIQKRNAIRFTNYNKFGTELRIIDEDDQIEDKSAPPKDKP